ncbi:MAG: ferredoxin--NADP reductase [Myxococcota bacterium]
MMNLDSERVAQSVSETDWQDAIRTCHLLRVAETIEETHDTLSIVFEVPAALQDAFAYRAGQFLSFKVPHEGKVLVRSYSLSSSPETDSAPKVTVKRVEDGRISNWMNDHVRADVSLMVVPPAGLFVLDPQSTRDVVLFSGGSGITPCISIIKTALVSSQRKLTLFYANRDARSIIFSKELESLQQQHPGRLEITHSLDAERGFVTADDVRGVVGSAPDRDFFLCGPGEFMDTVEAALQNAGVARDRIAIERFVSPTDPGDDATTDTAASETSGDAPATITIALDGQEHEVPYEPGERILEAARRAGLDPPFSCEEGYCSCCMAKAPSGTLEMATNDCLTPDLLEEGWVLTCQARCKGGGKVRIEYPD